MKTKVGNYIKTATYYTITNAITTPAVVSDPKMGAIYIHTVYSSEAKMAGATSTCSAPDDGGKRHFPILCA